MMESNYTVFKVSNSTPSAVSGLSHKFVGKDLTVTWNKATEPDFDYYKLILNSGTVKKIHDGKYRYSFDENIEQNTSPDPNITIAISKVDFYDNISATVNATAINSPPSVPTSLVAVGGSRAIYLRWNNNTVASETDIIGRDIYRYINSASVNATLVATVGSEETTYADGTVTSYDPTYYYWVEAVDGFLQRSGKSSYDTAFMAHTLASDLADDCVSSVKISVDQLSAINADLGDIKAGTVEGVSITAGLFRTSAQGRKVLLTSDGMTLHVTASVGKYGTFKYGDGTKYGSGALAYIQHSSQKVPFYISAEQTVADFHYFDRTSKPSGFAEVGDVCVVNGLLMRCDVTGTPGTWVCAATP